MEISSINSIDDNYLNQDLNISEISSKVKIYKNLLKNILVKTKIIKGKLDYYHLKLNKTNVKVQSSAIFFSATTLIIQSLLPSSYSNLKNSGNMSDNGSLEGENYSSLIVNGAKYLKIELKENIVSDLKNRFSEFIIRIKDNLELLRPWENEDYFKENDWNDVMKKLDEEYLYIISVRKDLYQEYEKIMPYKIDEKFNKKYNKEFNKINKLSSYPCD